MQMYSNSLESATDAPFLPFFEAVFPMFFFYSTVFWRSKLFHLKTSVFFDDLFPRLFLGPRADQLRRSYQQVCRDGRCGLRRDHFLHAYTTLNSHFFIGCFRMDSKSLHKKWTRKSPGPGHFNMVV